MLLPHPGYRAVSLYFRNGQYLVQPLFELPTGLSVAGEPVRVLGADASASDLGEAVQQSLGFAKAVASRPTYGANGSKPDPLLAAAQAKSWSAFMKSARACTLAQTGATLRATPSKRAATGGGLEFLADLQVTLVLPATPVQVGEAALETLARCQP